MMEEIKEPKKGKSMTDREPKKTKSMADREPKKAKSMADKESKKGKSMMDKESKKSKSMTGTLCESLHIRLPKQEKNHLKKEADAQGISVSDYVRLELSKQGNRKCGSAMPSICAVLSMDILSYIKEKYDYVENDVLQEKVAELWKLL